MSDPPAPHKVKDNPSLVIHNCLFNIFHCPPLPEVVSLPIHNRRNGAKTTNFKRSGTMFPAQQFVKDWAYPHKKLLKSHLNSHTNNVIFSRIQSSRVKYFTAVQVHFQWLTESTVKQHLRHIQLGQPNKLALEDTDSNTTITFDSRKPKSTKTHYMNQLSRYATEMKFHPKNMNEEDSLISNTSWKPLIHPLRQNRKPLQYG